MKFLFVFSALILSVTCFAQITSEQRIQDSIVGWDPKNIYDKYVKPPTTAIGKQKEIYVNKFAEWVKKSYTPVAGLGEYQRYINTNNYAVLFHVWDVAFDHLDAQKHFKPIGETGLPRFWMAANQLAGTWNIDFMNKDDWFFTMQPNGSAGQTPMETVTKMKGRDPKIHPNVYPYITWINDWEAVYLAPGNQLPIIQVTKGEFLNRALERLDYLQDSLIKEDIEKEYRKDEATKKSIVDRRKNEIDKYRNNISQLLSKYKSELNDPAYVTSWQFTFRDINVGNCHDVT